MPYGVTEADNRKIASSQVYMGQFPSADDYNAQPNVTLVQTFFTKADWTTSFPVANTIYSYENFLRAIAKWP